MDQLEPLKYAPAAIKVKHQHFFLIILKENTLKQSIFLEPTNWRWFQVEQTYGCRRIGKHLFWMLYLIIYLEWVSFYWKFSCCSWYAMHHVVTIQCSFQAHFGACVYFNINILGNSSSKLNQNMKNINFGKLLFSKWRHFST